jgi:molecular chaperone HscB
MEMLELNDQAMEAATAEEKQALFNQIENIKQEIYASVAPIVANYQEGITTEKELLQVKEYYYRKKYINRILAAVQQ